MAARGVPGWVAAPAAGGTTGPLLLPSALAHPLRVRLWTPHGLDADTPAPLLWCHDGTSYARGVGLLQWLGAHVHAGRLPPARVVLADATRRMQTYSASPRYLRSTDLAIDALRERVPVTHLAVMGASLGGLTSLLVALRRRDVGAVLAQSGSFFRPGDEPPGWPWLPRVERAVAGIGDLARRRGPDGLLVGITCGRHEDNLASNRAVARTLRAAGLPVTWRTVPGGHDERCWRDALDPSWRNLLRRAWFGAG